MKHNFLKATFIGSLFLAFSFSGCQNDEPVKACFSYQQYQDTVFWVQFQNCSENATEYLWQFSQGNNTTTATESNPKLIVTDFIMPTIFTLTAKNDDDSDVLTDTIYDWIMVYKPNIYLYPTQNESLCVELDFPKGGRVTASEPLYQDKWCVNVTPQGLINDQYRFLFYESLQPNIWQQTYGYCIAQSEIKQWFTTELARLNFSQSELADFVEYWVPKLDQYPYYVVYPQTKSWIDRVINVNFSKTPDTFYRLYFGFKGVEEPIQLQNTNIEPMVRQGFVAVEWGGFVL